MTLHLCRWWAYYWAYRFGTPKVTLARNGTRNTATNRLMVIVENCGAEGEEEGEGHDFQPSRAMQADLGFPHLNLDHPDPPG